MFFVLHPMTFTLAKTQVLKHSFTLNFCLKPKLIRKVK